MESIDTIFIEVKKGVKLKKETNKQKPLRIYTYFILLFKIIFSLVHNISIKVKVLCTLKKNKSNLYVYFILQFLEYYVTILMRSNLFTQTNKQRYKDTVTAHTSSFGAPYLNLPHIDVSFIDVTWATLTTFTYFLQSPAFSFHFLTPILVNLFSTSSSHVF